MFRLLVSILLFLFTCLAVTAQDKMSSKKHVKLAEQLLSEKKYSAAAQHYEAAWSQKPKKLEWLHLAAQCFLKAREYRKAADAFGTVKDNKFFPQARLYYAIALQQSGQFDEAIPEFLLYLNGNMSQERDNLQGRIEDYINGCSAAIRQSDSSESKKIELEHLSATVNSTDNDFAPIAFGDDILYFIQTTIASSKLLRTQQNGNEWTATQGIQNLSIPVNMTLESGAFSPDGSRFYCALSYTIQIKKEKKRTCAIYLFRRTDKGWSAPSKLSDRVNTEGGVTTHPFVFHKDGKEVLLFASDRTGGQGGMDIWNVTRDLKNESFSLAQNMGSNINTPEDEVTPYYDSEENALYFSSTARASFGGLDIFKSKGLLNAWNIAENIGAPFNSGADDYYFVKNKSLTGGFFVSNRTMGIEKISSIDDDIFSFRINNRIELNIVGQIFDKEGKNLMENARVTLFERKANDVQRLLSSIMASEGQYQFSLLPQKNYILEVDKDGYRQADYKFDTKATLKSISKDFNLEKQAILASIKTDNSEKENPKKTDAVATNENKSPKTKSPSQPKTSSTTPKTTSGEKITPITKPKSENGVTYKVQILAYEYLDNANRRRLSRVDDLGSFDTEKANISGKTFTRVMLAGYDTYTEASDVLKKVKDRSLTDAFIIRYENGKRTNKSK